MSLNDAERSTLVNLYMDRAWATYRDAKLAEAFIKMIEELVQK